MAGLSNNLREKSAFFHSTSRALTEESQRTYESGYKSSHITFAKEILADEIDHCPTISDAETFVTNNPNVIKYYDKMELTELPSSNGQTWYISDSGSWMRPMITPELIPHTDTNEPSDGFVPFLYDSEENIIGPTSGAWWIDPFQGMVRFQQGYTPQSMGYGTVKIDCFIYIGKTLIDFINQFKPITYNYISGAPSVRHDINHNIGTYDLLTNILVEDAVEGYWRKDLCDIKYITSNTVRVDLTEASNVRASIQKVDEYS